MREIDIVVVDITRMQSYDFEFEGGSRTGEELLKNAEDRKKENIAMYERYVEEYPGNAEYWSNCLNREKEKTFEVMKFDEFLKREREYYISKPMTEVTEEDYDEHLDVLPPLHYVERNGVVMFCMCEMWTGSYTNQYAYDKRTGKYWTKMVDCTDPTTWIDKFLRGDAA